MFPNIVGYPENINSNRVFPYKPSILRYPYFWKHPTIVLFFSVYLSHMIFDWSMERSFRNQEPLFQGATGSQITPNLDGKEDTWEAWKKVFQLKRHSTCSFLGFVYCILVWFLDFVMILGVVFSRNGSEDVFFLWHFLANRPSDDSSPCLNMHFSQSS